jgi:hypothetical protein
VIIVTVYKTRIVYFGYVYCSLNFFIGFGSGKERLMVVHLKTYHLYFYFKALKTKANSMPDEKRSGVSGWLNQLASGSRADNSGEHSPRDLDHSLRR